MSDEANKIIYSMVRVSKFYDKKPVLKDISLSYFYGAKIGVLGLNGAGKSSPLNSPSTPARIFSRDDFPAPLRPSTPILAP